MSLEMTQSVLFFLCSHTSVSPMPSIPPLSENVPFEEVAAILDEAAMQARGGPPCSIPAAGTFSQTPSAPPACMWLEPPARRFSSHCKRTNGCDRVRRGAPENEFSGFT